MTTSPAARTFEVRHVQIARAAFAAIAALMVTFSSDHSAEVGLSVFSGFAIATGLIFVLAAWLVFPAGQRWPAAVLGALAVIAGMIGGIVPLRSVTLFFSVVITWALVSGLVEALVGWSALRRARGSHANAGARAESRDALTVGILTVVLGLALLLVPTQYALQYTIADANATFTLTGIIIGVGLFGGYAAILAVYLAIAGFSPRKTAPAAGTLPTEISSATQERGAS